MIVKDKDGNVKVGSSALKIKAAIREVDRQHRKSRTWKDLSGQIEKQADRVKRAALREFADDVEDLVDSPRAGAIAKEEATKKAKTKGIEKNWKVGNRRLSKDVRDHHLKRVEEELLGVLKRSADPEVMRRRLTDLSAKAIRRADRIGRFETETLASNLSEKMHKAIGTNSYHWRTRRDAVVRPEHRKRESKVYSWDTVHSDGHPGEPPN